MKMVIDRSGKTVRDMIRRMVRYWSSTVRDNSSRIVRDRSSTISDRS